MIALRLLVLICTATILHAETRSGLMLEVGFQQKLTQEFQGVKDTSTGYAFQVAPYFPVRLSNFFLFRPSVGIGLYTFDTATAMSLEADFDLLLGFFGRMRKVRTPYLGVSGNLGGLLGSSELHDDLSGSSIKIGAAGIVGFAFQLSNKAMVMSEARFRAYAGAVSESKSDDSYTFGATGLSVRAYFQIF